MKSTSISCLFLMIGLLVTTKSLQAQQKTWLFLADKGSEQSDWLNHPEAFLSPRALERYASAGHVIAPSDVPVSASYRKQLADAGVKIHGSSRWINALSVETSLTLNELRAICPAVTKMQPVARFSTDHYDSPGPNQIAGKTAVDSFSYGLATFQTQQINLKCLHDRGFTGRNVLITIMDAGFFRMDTISAFDSLWQQGRVLTYRDFVNQDTTVFDEHNHGMNVASTIVSNLPGIMVGTAPHATLALARTENVFSETHQEEDNWLMGAEWADSLGADQIHSSLGYTLFDPGEGDFTYADLDGNTTIISRAADMAAARGILVVNSAGNEGNSPWRHISAPCDGDSILCVGAVDQFNSWASFSGIGPSADGQVKPDVAALGLGAAVIGIDGTVGGASGTSFSAPIMSGFAACLKQAHPVRSNMQIIHAIQQSASQYANPDTLLGYGIPDACKADSILEVLDSLILPLAHATAAQQIRIFPNPATDILTLQNTLASNPMATLLVTGADGRTVVALRQLDGQQGLRTSLPIKSLAAGIYFVHITLEGGQMQVSRFIKD